MKFVVGVGNPGRAYAGTRHNIGFAVVDALGDVTGARTLKPDTFVNRTGNAVAELVRKHGAKPAEILVVCDDVNLDFGKLRLRASGSAGGHHGLESVIEALQTDAFARLRFGVRTEHMPAELSGFVLEKFSKEEQKRLPEIIGRAAAVCQAWIAHGLEEARLTLSRLQSIP